MKLRCVRPHTLSPSEIEEMYLLSTIHFVNLQRDRFEQSLMHSDWLLLFQRQSTGMLEGFAPFWLRSLSSGISVVLDANRAVLDPGFADSLVLPSLWLGLAQALCHLHPGDRIHWLMACDSYRTYRILAGIWEEIYPCHHSSTPENIQGIIHKSFEAIGQSLATQSLTGHLPPDPQGILSASLGRLRRRQFQDSPLCLRKDPNTQFFIRQNPGYHLGDRLVCCVELSQQNLTHTARRRWLNNPTAHQWYDTLSRAMVATVEYPTAV
jgi:hypothetical protein